MYGHRNHLDFRVAKLLRFRSTRTMVRLDLYDPLNTFAVLTYNNTFAPGGAWQQPQQILSARIEGERRVHW